MPAELGPAFDEQGAQPAQRRQQRREAQVERTDADTEHVDFFPGKGPRLRAVERLEFESVHRASPAPVIES